MTFLSSKGFSNLIGCQVDEDFSFVTDAKTYKCNRIIAIFLSPVVAKAIKSDASLNEFKINDPTNCFEIIYKSLQGESLSVDISNAVSIFDIANQLGNSELAKIANEYIQQEIDPVSVIWRMKAKFILNINYNQELEYAFNNIDKINLKDLAKIGLEFVNIFLGLISPKTNEHCDEISTIILESITLYGSDSSVLLKYFPISISTNAQITELLTRIKPSMITGDLWRSLITKLGMNKESLPENTNELIANQDPIDPPKEEFKGIFYSLKMKYESDDLVEDKIVEISSTTDDTNNLSKVLDPFNLDYFITSISKITENSPAVVFHFMTERVSISAYTIKTSYHSRSINHLVSWAIEGSNDGINWDMLDKHEDCHVLNDPNAVATFRTFNDSCYWYIRLRLLGKNESKTARICFNAIEFYGKSDY